MFTASKQKIKTLAGECPRIKTLSAIRCFWTWPFGHVWCAYGGSYDRQCMICKSVSSKGMYDGDWMYDILHSKYKLSRIIKKYVVIVSIIILMTTGIGVCNQKYYLHMGEVSLVRRGYYPSRIKCKNCKTVNRVQIQENDFVSSNNLQCGNCNKSLARKIDDPIDY